MGAAPVTLPGPVVVHREFAAVEGSWKVAGTSVFRNVDSGNAVTYGTCSGSFDVAQDGGRFSGPLQTRGFGWNSDRFCTATGTLTGELSVDNANVSATLDGNFQNWPRPSVQPSCETIAAGDGIWTGTAGSQEIHLQVRDLLRCAANVDGGLLNMPMATFERTVSLVFQR